jgi:MFS superfamily sulfate permease-like transporter
MGMLDPSAFFGFQSFTIPVNKLNMNQVFKDLNAGLVVFLVAIPLCLGIALASKAPLMSGVIAGVLGGLVVGALSGSQLGVSGPAAGLVATTIAGIAACGSFEAFCMATMIAGCIQIALGLVRAGALARYFPTSVIKGMLAAIGIIIVLKQIPHIVGLDSDYEGDMNFFQADGHTTLSELGYLLDALTPGALVIGLVGLAIMIVWSLPLIQKVKVLSLIPGPLLAVTFGITMQSILAASGSPLALEPAHLVQVTASQNPIDWISTPDFSKLFDSTVLFYAVVVALIASVESLLCAEATDKIDPHLRVANKNKELWAQGVGNVFSGLVGGLPITQVIVRSSANVQAGGQTRLATIFHGLLILVAVVAIPNVLNAIPMASLAAVLIMVGYNLAKPSLIKKYYKKGWTQFIPFIVTIPAVLLTDLLIGVGIGIAVAIFFILRRSFRAPYTYHIIQASDHQVVLLKFANILSFLNKGVIIQTLESLPARTRVIIDVTNVGFIDPDIVEAIEDFVERAPTKGIEVELKGTLDHTAVSKNPTKDLRDEIKQLTASFAKNPIR